MPDACTPPEDRWDFYQTQIDDQPASVFINLDIARRAPQEDRPWSLVASLQLKDPPHHGMTQKPEADVLWQVEDAVVPAVTEACDAVFVGRTTGSGRRVFFFFAHNPHPFTTAVSRALIPFQYEFDAEANRDPGWSAYFDFLYPAKKEFQAIRNQHVLTALKENGDDLATPRRIHHWLYFKTEQAREQFIPDVKANGFGILRLEPSLEPSKDGKPPERPFGLQIHRIDSVQWNDINQVVWQLLDLAKQHDGDYDGWETQIVKPGQQPTEDAPPES